MNQVANPSHLSIGDRFFEDCYPEIWEVYEVNVDYQGCIGINARVVGYLDPKWDTDRMGEESFWGATQDYVMTLYRI